jgi:hypothetical protein
VTPGINSTHSGHGVRYVGGSSSQTTLSGISPGHFGHVGEKCQTSALG